MNKISCSDERPRRRRADLADVVFRLGAALMCVVFTGVVLREELLGWTWYVWAVLAVVATALVVLGTWLTVRSFWRGW